MTGHHEPLDWPTWLRIARMARDIQDAQYAITDLLDGPGPKGSSPYRRSSNPVAAQLRRFDQARSALRSALEDAMFYERSGLSGVDPTGRSEVEAELGVRLVDVFYGEDDALRLLEKRFNVRPRPAPAEGGRR